ncbi:hypothetical protein KAU15_01035, partial [candidate division WOR-3 bacterium]|nr:hypothetical protein [candidate division WOR-3 bacterium]
MKKLLILVPIILLIFAGCDILGPVVIDHSDTVEHYTNGEVYDFDQAGGSGWAFSDNGGENLSVTGNAELIDFFYNERDYTEATFMSPDGDDVVYPIGDKTVNETRFIKISIAADDDAEDLITDTAPSAGYTSSVKAEDDNWYWIQLDNADIETVYVLMHVTNLTTDFDEVEFEYWL